MHFPNTTVLTKLQIAYIINKMSRYWETLLTGTGMFGDKGSTFGGKYSSGF